MEKLVRFKYKSNILFAWLVEQMQLKDGKFNIAWFGLKRIKRKKKK